MGLDENRFVESVDDEFRCSICRDVIEDPIATQCEHVFCKTCINEWIQKESSCPVDRKTLNKSQLCEPSRFFRNFYSKLELKCEYESNGCDIFSKIEDLKSHQDKCKFNPSLKYECDKGCGALTSKIDEKNHNCLQFLKSDHFGFQRDIDNLTNRVLELEECVKNLQIVLSTKCDEIIALQRKIEILSAHSTSILRIIGLCLLYS